MLNAQPSFTRTPIALIALRWLATLHIIGGIGLAISLWLPSLHPLILKTMYGNTPIDNPQQTLFWICIMGPTVASWGVLCRICVDYFAEQPSKRTYRRLILAMAVWAPLDTTMCLSNGIYIAGFLNASVVLLFWYLCHRLWLGQQQGMTR